MPPAAVLGTLLALALPCYALAHPAGQPTLNVRFDNDLLGGLQQDQGYSHGFALQWATGELASPAVSKLNRYLAWLQPQAWESQRLVFSARQMLFTPQDRQAQNVVPGDRPFAGVVLFGAAYAARQHNSLQVTQLSAGLVGPDTKTKQFQHAWHDAFGVERFQGWRHQLRNEPVVQLVHERRVRPWRHNLAGQWHTDVIYHGGASVGNYATYVNSGAEWRLGVRLPDDFGSSALRPAGDNLLAGEAVAQWRAHLFVALDMRWVLRDITLDGNTFQRSHRVAKRAFVADVAYGVAVEKGAWRLAFSRYQRSQEFVGQKERPAYGSLSVARRF